MRLFANHKQLTAEHTRSGDCSIMNVTSGRNTGSPVRLSEKEAELAIAIHNVALIHDPICGLVPFINY